VRKTDLITFYLMTGSVRIYSCVSPCAAPLPLSPRAMQLRERASYPARSVLLPLIWQFLSLSFSSCLPNIPRPTVASPWPFLNRSLPLPPLCLRVHVCQNRCARVHSLVPRLSDSHLPTRQHTVVLYTLSRSNVLMRRGCTAPTLIGDAVAVRQASGCETCVGYQTRGCLVILM
jgi:hypothetical protein